MTLTLERCLSCGAGLSASLNCDYCGSRHIRTDQGYAVSCSSCGTPNLPMARCCVQCGAERLRPCPECSHRNPIPARFCAECKIDLKNYKSPKITLCEILIPPEKIRETLSAWIGSGWFRARDFESFDLMDQQLIWAPIWRFRARFAGKVQGAVKHTHYRLEARQVEVDEGPEEGDMRIQPWPDSGASRRKRTETRYENVPYDVWQPTSKDFNENICLSAPAFQRASLPSRPAWPESKKSELQEIPKSGSKLQGGEVLAIDSRPEQRFDTFKSQARAALELSLLDRVDSIEAQCFQPTLELTYLPFWELIYRYKRSRRRAQINAVTGECYGQSVSLWNQWFG